ncbi:MAG: PepSY domain-containing protein [Chthoniobacterales bacterium]
MKTTRTILLIVAIGTALAAPAFAHGHHHGNKQENDEQKVEWSDVPAAVQTTIQQNSAGGQVVEVEKEMKGDKSIYEAEVKGTDGKLSEVKVNEDGTLIKVQAKQEDGEEHGDHEDKD